nr:immunoglobulin heavy chain junction region [Macaca mulatta]MPN70739.1 immunoglobulin heavy chain junction region [Macaca mulatta]MPN70981.1 immunoglobulin heavy chain junction region [Macaca mulatta]MPN73017.1 immunoglobulin heavy chain junction region [Macaca mulatta]MPN74411.1 immunoglobulin heavy chain junction region [Macaca mulatta]
CAREKSSWEYHFDYW